MAVIVTASFRIILGAGAAYRRADDDATFVAGGRNAKQSSPVHPGSNPSPWSKPDMPQRDNELPEGTDHIINGAMETDTGGGAGTGGGGASSGFIGSAAAEGSSGAGALAETGGIGGAGGTGGGGVADQLRNQAASLRDQAGGRVREFAQGGKARATDALDELSRVVGDTADSIDERLGNNYGQYARKAADAVSTFADTLRRKEVEDLYDEMRSAVRKSPAVAVGIAAVVGFTLVRLVKSGLEDGRESGGGSTGGTGA
jgi:ElaB/YqjD/DUF883 family membrane-anchored ribosome-binding protein